MFFVREARAKNMLWIEGESLPFDARTAKGCVQLCFENVRNPVAAFPSRETPRALGIINAIHPKYMARANILDVALHNPNLVIHTIGAIMSVARIEHSRGEFWMYKEAFTPTMLNLVSALDQEKIRILEAFGLGRETIWETFRTECSKDPNADAYEAFLEYGHRYAPKGPSDAQTRYITEDVSIGLSLMSSLGGMVGVKTPACDGLIQVASALHQQNYRALGRTVAELGWSGWSPAELTEFLTTGITPGAQ